MTEELNNDVLEERTVTIAPGKPYERTVVIKEPVGRKGRAAMTPLFTFALELMEFGDDVARMAMHALTNKDYERLYVPLALGLNDKEGKEWLEENGTVTEILTAFLNAVQILMEASAQPAVTEAVKK